MWKSHHKCRSFSQALHRHVFFRICSHIYPGWRRMMLPTDWSFLFQMGWKVVKIFRSKWCYKYGNSEDLSGFWGFEGVNYPGVNWLGVTILVEVSLWLINKTWSMTSWHYEFIVEWSGYPQEWLINCNYQTSHTSSTAQGGGGSFKNRKPIGEVGCCESRMAERSHWWTERCLISLFLSFSFCLYIYLSLIIYLPTYWSICLSIYLSVYLSPYVFI